MDRATSPGRPPALRGDSHETSDVYLPGIVLFLVITAFSAFVIHAAVWGWLRNQTQTPAIDAASSTRTGTASVTKNFSKLQINSEKELQTYKAEQAKLLATYGWINRTAGIARVPISEAMNQIVSRGVPNWSTGKVSASPLELQRMRPDQAGKAAGE